MRGFFPTLPPKVGDRDIQSLADGRLLARPTYLEGPGDGRTRGVVQRDALFERLSAASGVVLVCAPAGSGKTMLLRSWIQASGRPDRVGWVSVRRGERDAQRFWVSVIDALVDTLRAHECELRRLGVSHAAVFGSVARGEAGTDSDVDVLVELDQDRPIGIFEYARLKLYINELLEGTSDVVNRRTLKPLLRDSILRDAVHAF